MTNIKAHTPNLSPNEDFSIISAIGSNLYPRKNLSEEAKDHQSVLNQRSIKFPKQI